MPIRIDYSPVRELTALAQAAGAGVARQRQAAGDIAYTQMILGQQARNAEIAARLQASDRAFALQQAAASRQVRTPTRAPTMPGPIVSEMVRAQREESQMEQLDRMRDSGQLNEAEYQRSKINLMAGREIVKPTPTPKVPTKLSVAARAIKHTEKRNQRRIERQLTAEERKLRVDPYAEPGPEKIRVEKAEKKIIELEAALQASYQREDTALGVGIQPQATGAARGPSVPEEKLDVLERPSAVSILKRLTSAEEDALMDMYIAETKGDIEAAKRLWAERTGR